MDTIQDTLFNNFRQAIGELLSVRTHLYYMDRYWLALALWQGADNHGRSPLEKWYLTQRDDVEALLKQAIVWSDGSMRSNLIEMYRNITGKGDATLFIELLAELYAETVSEVSDMCDAFLATGEMPKEADMPARFINATLPSGEVVEYDTLATEFLTQDEQGYFQNNCKEYMYTTNWGVKR